MTKKILHVDMDAFFAQVEQRDFPDFRGKPLVVGSPNARGVVAAASYEARKFGIHSAMPSSIAKQKCPTLLFAAPRFDVYRSVSEQIRAIFTRYTPLIEPLSLDEAYLDITALTAHGHYATQVAKDIQHCIFQELSLTSSVGVSYNKFLAKIASNVRKPFGITVITPAQALTILSALPIEKFYGIGERTAHKMHSLGIHNGHDLKQRSLAELKLHFGKAGESYYLYARGEDARLVNPIQETLSVSAENTFEKDIIHTQDIQRELTSLIHALLKRLQRNEFHGKTFAIKIRYANFNSVTRSKTFSTALPHDFKLLEQYFWELYATIPKHPIRLIGLTIQTPDYQHERQINLPF